jgi:hypothetical protein
MLENWNVGKDLLSPKEERETASIARVENPPRLEMRVRHARTRTKSQRVTSSGARFPAPRALAR